MFAEDSFEEDLPMLLVPMRGRNRDPGRLPMLSSVRIFWSMGRLSRPQLEGGKAVGTLARQG